LSALETLESEFQSAATMPGFGLELYICKDIIKRHKGNIWVDTEDHGSTFSFSMPKNQFLGFRGRSEQDLTQQ